VITVDFRDPFHGIPGGGEILAPTELADTVARTSDGGVTWELTAWPIHGAVRVKDRQGAARLGRYMIRCPVALKRLSSDEDTAQVAYKARPTRGISATQFLSH
jgi:hypothetical protein